MDKITSLVTKRKASALEDSSNHDDSLGGRNRRRSSRRRIKPKTLNIDGSNESYVVDLTQEYYTNVGSFNIEEYCTKGNLSVDELRNIGKGFWFENTKAKLPFLCKYTSGLCMYPSKYHRDKLISKIQSLFALGTRCVHYALGYIELGIMVEKYGKNVDKDWPNLPSTESGIQTPPAAIATSHSSIKEVNPSSSNSNNSSNTARNPSTTGTTAIPDPITIKTAYIGNNTDHTRTSTSTNSTTIETNVNPHTSIVSTNAETNRQANEESIPFVTATPDLCASSALEPTARRERTTPPRTPSISNRLQRLDRIFLGSQKESGRQEGILKRLGSLEEQVFGDQYDKALKGVLCRLRRLEEISNRLQKLEVFFFGSHNARGGISKRLENLECEVFGSQCDDKPSSGVVSRLEGLEELAS